MILGSYNGASLLAFPSQPAPKSIELGMNDSVAINRSPFTGSMQVQAWPGADLWDANIALPKLLGADAAVWSAFLAECRGMLNVFPLADPAYKGPQGTVPGSPVVNGVNNAMAAQLNIKGLPANSFGVLLPGDYLQLGSLVVMKASADVPALITYTYNAGAAPSRLYRVLNRVNTDGSGNATIQIWPSLREATTDGQAINLNNPIGLFRLAENRRSILTDETHLSGVTIKAIEAR